MGREAPVSAAPNAERWTVIADLIAGGTAGFCADSIFHSLDTVKSRLHVQRGPPFKYHSMAHAFVHLSRHEGLRGLYAGFGAVLCGSIPMHAIMFAGYKALKRRGEAVVPLSEGEDAALALVDVSSGAVGEFLALPVFVPAEVIAKRMQVATLGYNPHHSYHSVSHAATTICRTEGHMALMNGFWATVARDVPYTAIQFSLFSVAKDNYRAIVDKPRLNDVEATVLGAGVGVVAASLTNPFDVVKTRLMTQNSKSASYRSIFHCMHRIVAEEGLISLCRGLTPRILWLAPGSGVTLAVYERVSMMLKDFWHLEQREVVR